jgi:hypothetical protein
MRRSAMRILLLVVTTAILLSLGTVGEAAPICHSVVSGTSPVECRFLWSNLAGVSASFLRIVVKDVAPTEQSGQTVWVYICDRGSLGDRFQITTIRTQVPQDIFSCVTRAGSENACVANPTPKADTAVSDTVLLIVQDVSGAAGDTDDAVFVILTGGWEDLKVFVEDNQNASVSVTSASCPID